MVIRLIRSILFLPFYLYMNLMERLVRLCFKFTFLFIKIAESVPIVGPLMTKVVDWLSRTRFILWV